MIRVQRTVLLLLFTLYSLLFTNSACPEGAKYSFSAMEKAFLDGNYRKSVNEAGGLIGERASKREEIYYIKGLSELKLGRYPAARKSFQAIIARYAFSKRIFDAYIGLGDSYYLEKDLNAAIKNYDEAVFKFPNDENIALAYFGLAKCYAAKGDTAGANDYFEKGRKLAPLSFEARAGLKADAIKSGAVKETVTYRAPVAAAAEGEHSVQVGYFKSRTNAERLSQKLRLRGYDAYVEVSSEPEGRFYRTKIGHYKTAEEAVKASENLKEKGYSTRICAGDVCR